MIVMRRAVEVDGKVRTEINYPTGYQDVIRIQKTGEQFRVMYDTKGRFVLHRITPEEAQYKLCRVLKYSKAKKASIGRNPFQTGQAGTIPYIVTHDGRTIRYPDPAVRPGDSIKFDIATGKATGHLKFDVGQLAMVTKGNNIGRVGTVVHKEKHPGSFDIIHLRDKRGNAFATRSGNVFIIGDGTKPWVSLPNQKGIRLNALEEKVEKATAAREKNAKKAVRAAKNASK